MWGFVWTIVAYALVAYNGYHTVSNYTDGHLVWASVHFAFIIFWSAVLWKQVQES